MMFNHEVWQTIFSDDLTITAHGVDTKYEDIVLTMFIWCLLGTPFSWHKTRGGLQMEWLGYWLDYRRFEAGITEKRAAWLAKWIGGILEAKACLVRNITEGLGRLGFAAGVLEWHRPFLAPLYAWTAVLPQGTYIALPPMVRLAFMHIKDLSLIHI